MLRISPHSHHRSYSPTGNLNTDAGPSLPNTHPNAHSATSNGNRDPSTATHRDGYAAAYRDADSSSALHAYA